MMKESIENFAEQFSYNPVIENQENWGRAEKFLLCGMGGSHWQGDIVRLLCPALDLAIHSDYGLPRYIDKKRAVIASSYSGNTEEPISSFMEAKEKGFSLAVSTTGGKLLEMAKGNTSPYIQIPDTGIQPRSALGYATRALLKLVGEEAMFEEVGELAKKLSPVDLEKKGEELAKALFGKVPVIYSSRRNGAIANNWRIRFHESAKIPAFSNVFPELNHNEMTGFDVIDSTKGLSENIAFVFLKDSQDDERIQKRMEVVKEQYRERGLQVEALELEGEGLGKRIFSSVVLADWTALHTAKLYGTEPEKVPMVEEFKRRIA